MKKTLSVILSVLILMTAFIALPTASADPVKKDCSKLVNVSTYKELKTELENEDSINKTIALTDDLYFNDDTNYSFTPKINIKNSGTVVLDLKGHDITVNSILTSVVFNIDTGISLYILNTDKSHQSNINFYTADDGELWSEASLFRTNTYKADIFTYDIDYCINTSSLNTDIIDSENVVSNIFSVYGGNITVAGGYFLNYFKCGSVFEYYKESESCDLVVGGGATLKTGYSPICYYGNCPQTISLYDCSLQVVDTLSFNKSRINDITEGSDTFEKVVAKNKVSGSNGTVYDSALGSNVSLSTKLASNTHNLKIDCPISERTYKDSGLVFATGSLAVDEQTGCFSQVKAHNFEEEGGTYEEPSCTTDGKEADQKCKDCGFVLKGEVIGATGHTFEPEHNGGANPKATLKADGKFCAPCMQDCGYVNKTTIYKIKTVKLSKTKFVYNGKAQKPKVTVKNRKGEPISTVQYTVKYSNNKKVGKATATVKFGSTDEDVASLYSGTVKLTFKIVPKATKISKLTPAKKSLKVVVKKQATQTTGYQVQYSTKSNMKSAKIVTLKGAKTTTKTIKKLKAKTKYYVRVRTYKTVGKTKYYSSWSKVVNKKTK